MSNNVLGTGLNQSRLLVSHSAEDSNRLWTRDTEAQTVLSCRLLYTEHAIYHSGCENVIEKEGQGI